ncbi:dicarboxylate/amino acid:cation symporter [Leptospira fletcheri]|uniref:Dicarboxylate/amino acid:cation symporter n=1 Tax=Leptospira fletcheri TaxID=2484981 RepID=A0A4R9GG80_9LEPT|nr:dicarboxylate/amino acid:cation symporter [Leptospira fletcheri]TGK11692.1 dicarboxylate/amino acid:cation symporter [Leptospira fletcheri]
MVVFERIRRFNSNLIALIRKELWSRVLLGLFLGTIVGLCLSPEYELVSKDSSSILSAWLGLPGQLFLILLQMIMIPLVFSSILLGVSAGETVENLRKFGFRVFLYFVFTTFVAVSFGIAIASFIRPGNFVDPAGIPETGILAKIPTQTEAPSFQKIPELFLSVLPKNPFQTLFAGDMLGVVLLGILVGVALLSLDGPTFKSVTEMFQAVFKTSMVFVNWAMKLAPFAVFGLIAQMTAKIGFHILVSLGVYFFCVLGGLVFILFFYSLLLALVAKRNPIRFFKNAGELQLLAFSTSSSAAVLPFTLRTGIEKMGVSKKIAEFIIPLGATINMDGTALYQATATVFLAQVYGIELTLFQLGFVLVATVIASIGTPSTPGLGIVILATILTGVGIPTEGIGIIFGVDRLLDMCRTVVNVTGDLVACNVFQRLQDAEENSSS